MTPRPSAAAQGAGAERFPSGPSCTAPFPRKQPFFGSARSGPGRGTRQSGPLTARTDPGSSKGEGKGKLRTGSSTREVVSGPVPKRSQKRDQLAPFHRSLLSAPSFPSLPAGINTDDSDPLGAGIVACYKVPLSGPVGTPVSGGGGGALSSPLIFLYRHYGSRIVVANHGKQKTSRNVGMSRPHAFPCYTPLFVTVTKNKRSFVTRKTPQIGSLKPAPKNGLPGTSNNRQSRPLSEAPPLREVSGVPCTDPPRLAALRTGL